MASPGPKAADELPDLAEILACPGCGQGLPGLGSWPAGGQLCSNCGARFPLVRGVPRFVDSDGYTASFSFEWTRHRLTQLDGPGRDESERAFREKTGLGPEDLRGKLVLDVGCGMGRFADVVSRWGGTAVGVDLSLAVDAAQENIGERPTVRILQADVFRLPFRPASFDVIYSLGVLHHTPDCEKAFRQLPRLLKPGGKIAVWVYHKDMGLWELVARRYRRYTVRLPKRLLYALCHVAVPMYYLHKIPLFGEMLHKLVPTSLHPDRGWRVLDTFDWYSPAYQSLHSYPEVYEWFRSEGLEEIRLLHFPVSLQATRPGT